MCSMQEGYNQKYGVDDELDAQSGNMSNTYRRWADHVGSKNGSYYGFGSGVDGFMLQGDNDEEDFNTAYNEDFVRVQEMVEQHDADQSTMRDELDSLKRAQEAQSRKIDELLESQASYERNLKKFVTQEVSKAVAQDVGKIVAQEIAKSNRQLLEALRKRP